MLIENYKLQPSFEHVLKRDKHVHASFNNHKNPFEIASKMLDEYDRLMPFYKFYRNVKVLIDGYDRDLLEKEYCMAICRAHQIVDWYQFEQNKDILPNLLWEPSTHPNGCMNHEKFWNKIWSIDDPFWKLHHPGDCLDCQCYLSATDKPVTDDLYRV